MAELNEITQLLLAWGQGDQSALARLVPLVQAELRRIARSYMKRERPNHTLQTTALINEAYLKLIDQKNVHWQNRAHFYGIAAQCMRRILLDYAKRHRSVKRGGGVTAMALSSAPAITPETSEELIMLDEALANLARLDERKSRIVELRFFGGMEMAEIAELLRISESTVARDWSLARVWLKRELDG